MRLAAAVALLALAAASVHARAAPRPEDLLAQGYAPQKTFRDKQVLHHADKSHTVVIDNHEPIRPLFMDELMESMTPHHKARVAADEALQARRRELGENPYAPDRYWGWIPVYVGSVAFNQAITFSGGCFAANILTVTYDGLGTANFTLASSVPENVFCEDYYLIATATSWHAHLVNAAGVAVIEWHNFNEKESEDISRNGFRVFRFLQNEVDTLLDIYETAQLFLGALGLNTGGNASTHVPDNTAAHNIKFLKDYANLNLVPRTGVQTVPLDPSEIESGDFIGIVRLDGLDPTIMWGSGSALGHTTVALWIDGELNICESQSKSNYWPVNLVQCNPYADWIAYATAADYNVVHLPLSKEKRAQFNETAAVAFAKSVVGNLYGFQNMLFTWLDTPDQNMPEPVDPHYLVVMLGILDPILEDVLLELHTPSLWNSAFNMRLGTFYTRTIDIFAYAATKNISFGDLLSWPEQDWWMYPGHEPFYPTGVAMVCDVFVCYVYKAAGLFGDLANQINCAEFTPLDVYELAWFDNSPIPAKCEAADPGNKFCQILGKYRVVLPEWNTVTPFAHMREHCPSMPPYTDRYNPVAKATC